MGHDAGGVRPLLFGTSQGDKGARGKGQWRGRRSMVQKEHSQTDELLLPFLRATEEEGHEILAALIANHVEPLVKQIVHRKLCPRREGDTQRRQDAEDVSREAIVNVIRRLRAARADSKRPGIASLGSYVAVTAYNACNDYVRQKYPERHRLNNRLRYVLAHQETFDLWEGPDNQWLCGLRGWRGSQPMEGGAGSGANLEDCSEVVGRLARSDVQGRELVLLLAEVLTCVGRPVPFEDLVNRFAYLWGLNAVSELRLSHAADGLSPTGQRDESLLIRLELRAYLRRLWAEICVLPLHHRSALLLNLRDSRGQDIITIFVDTSVATIRQIAEALSMPVTEFVELWNDLPCDDVTIAQRLGLTRQQVVSLRQSARRRLARRMNALDKVV